MTLLIEADEADVLTQALVRMTGESAEAAVITALRDRLGRKPTRQDATQAFTARLSTFSEKIRSDYGTRPITPEEWAAA